MSFLWCFWGRLSRLIIKNTRYHLLLICLGTIYVRFPQRLSLWEGTQLLPVLQTLYRSQFSSRTVTPTPCRPRDDRSRVNRSDENSQESRRECRSSVRRYLKKLEQREEDPLVFDLDRFECNREKVDKLVVDIRRFYGNRWSGGMIEGAMRMWFRGRKEEAYREKTGKKAEHRRTCRRNKRVKDKIARRRDALKMVQWPQADRMEMERALVPCATSPEKSDEEGQRFRTPLVWESSLLARRKLELDTRYMESLSVMNRAKIAKVIDHPTETVNGDPPTSVDSWAVSKRILRQIRQQRPIISSDSESDSA